MHYVSSMGMATKVMVHNAEQKASHHARERETRRASPMITPGIANAMPAAYHQMQDGARRSSSAMRMPISRVP